MTTSEIDPNWAPGYADRHDYRVDILRRRNTVTARYKDQELARSERTLLIDEQNHGLVFYFPRTDVDMSQLVAVERVSHCPYKGVARYWAFKDGDRESPIAWSYDEPYPEVSQLAGNIAFYQDRVTVSLGVAIFPIPKRK
jgi:uncharacterized protein (DUF427 family)